MYGTRFLRLITQFSTTINFDFWQITSQGIILLSYKTIFFDQLQVRVNIRVNFKTHHKKKRWRFCPWNWSCMISWSCWIELQTELFSKNNDTNTNTHTNWNTNYNWRYDHKYNLKTAVKCSWLDLHSCRQSWLADKTFPSQSSPLVHQGINAKDRKEGVWMKYFFSSQCTMARTTS